MPLLLPGQGYAGAKGLERDSRGLTATQIEGRRIQDALSKITSFREMKQGVMEARGEWAKAQGEVERLAQSMASVATPTRKMQREFENARRIAADAKTAFETQRESLQRLRNEMMTGATALTIQETNAKLAEQKRY
ncbi:MAG: hypothetical protein G8345_18795 [Magnetococcales bacterium]|nr:hypothetical protein [Magnetococcales bacterium]